MQDVSIAGGGLTCHITTLSKFHFCLLTVKMSVWLEMIDIITKLILIIFQYFFGGDTNILLFHSCKSYSNKYSVEQRQTCRSVWWNCKQALTVVVNTVPNRIPRKVTWGNSLKDYTTITMTTRYPQCQNKSILHIIFESYATLNDRCTDYTQFIYLFTVYLLIYF